MCDTRHIDSLSSPCYAIGMETNSMKYDAEDAAYAGQSAALFVELSLADAKALVEDVDPEVWDRFQPEPPLSGEWAGGFLPQDVEDPDEFEEAYFKSYWAELMSAAREVVTTEAG